MVTSSKRTRAAVGDGHHCESPSVAENDIAGGSPRNGVSTNNGSRSEPTLNTAVKPGPFGAVGRSSAKSCHVPIGTVADHEYPAPTRQGGTLGAELTQPGRPGGGSGRNAYRRPALQFWFARFRTTSRPWLLSSFRPRSVVSTSGRASISARKATWIWLRSPPSTTINGRRRANRALRSSSGPRAAMGDLDDDSGRPTPGLDGGRGCDGSHASRCVPRRCACRS